jgi:HEAT repeat protein
MQQDNIADQVLAYLRQEETDYQAAAKLGPPALPVLRDIIKGTDEMLASKATFLVSMISSDETADIIKTAARHSSPLVRVAAASSAGKLKAEDAGAVLDLIMEDNDVGVSKLALRSIKSLHLGKRFETKLKAMSTHSPDSTLKSLAADALNSK